MSSHPKTSKKNLTQSESLHTAISHISDEYLLDLCTLDPILATTIGVSGYDADLPDYSPAAAQERQIKAQKTQQKIAALPLTHDTCIHDRICVSIMQNQIKTSQDEHSLGIDYGEINNITSPSRAFTDVLSLMSLETEQDCDNVRLRLRGIPRALETYQESLLLRQRLQRWPIPTLQVQDSLTHARQIRTEISQILARPHPENMRWEQEIDTTVAAYTDYANFLETHILPQSTSHNAVGRDLYPHFLEKHLGTRCDIEQTYQWGYDHLQSIINEQHTLAQSLTGSRDIQQAYDYLDNHPDYCLYSPEKLQQWMQNLSDATSSQLAQTALTIPEPLLQLRCAIAESGTGGVYYTSPSEDFQRPGTMWWAVSPTQKVFHTWKETTTVFHEGIPGHHLQLGTALLSPHSHRLQKVHSFIPGHGEGWALYAERLMHELGFLDDPGSYMGMLDAARLRAARVVLDIGYHYQLPQPGTIDTPWDYHSARAFLAEHAALDPVVEQFEVHRYLGWPGQAPSYSIGMRAWMDLRSDIRSQFPSMTLREFHDRALSLGGVGLHDLSTFVKEECHSHYTPSRAR